MLLRLISGLIYPTKGHVLIDGKMLGSDLEFPPSIGFLIENPTFLPQYTGAENLQMLSSLHQMMPTAQIESVLQRVGLHDTKYKKYSLDVYKRQSKVRPVHSTARKAYSPRTYASVTRLPCGARTQRPNSAVKLSTAAQSGSRA